MKLEDIRIEVIESLPFSENTYILWVAGSTSAIIFDPGFDAQSIIELLNREKLNPVAIINTHGHADHIAGNRVMKQTYPEAPLIAGRNEALLLIDPDANLSAPFGLPVTSPPADRLLDEGETLDVAGLSFEVKEIPGHSPGSIIFYCGQTEPPFVISGDVLFEGSIGRTDFPGGSLQQLLTGIREKLFVLPEDTVVFSGHGPSTTIGDEKRYNPFVGVNAGPIRLG